MKWQHSLHFRFVVTAKLNLLHFAMLYGINFVAFNHLKTVMKNYLFLEAYSKLRIWTIFFVTSVCPSVRPSAWNNSAPTERIFMKFDI